MCSADLGELARGVEVGGVTISPGAILRSVVVLTIGLALVRAFMRWLEGRYLPATDLDGSGRNSVSLVARYVGIALAVIWALASLGIGVERIALASCETTSSSEYRTSMRGLKISTRRRANSARFRRRISSSVLPENIEPHITSIQPFWLAFSKNILLLLCFVSLFRASAGRYSSTRVIRAPRALRRPSMSL